MYNWEYEQTSVRYPLSMGAMTKEELDAEIEKGYADMLAGRTILAQEAFAEVRSKFEREMTLAEQSIREEGTISADELEAELFSSESNITREGAMQAFMALRAHARDNGVSDMNLDEINSEIDLVRLSSSEIKPQVMP